MCLGSAEPRGNRMAGIDGFHLRGIAPQPQPLFAQAIADAGRPADIGAPVHVITDPAGEAVGQQLQCPPAIRPTRRCLCQQRADDSIARILPARERRHRRIMFEIERDRRALRIDDAHCLGTDIAAASRRRDRFSLRRGEQERGVRGKHDMEQRTLPTCGKIIKRGRCGGKAAQSGKVILQCHGGQQMHQFGSAALQAFAFEFGHQRASIGQRHLPRFQFARKFQTELENRVEQRRFDGPRMQRLQAG